MVKLLNNYTIICKDLSSGNLTEYNDNLNFTDTVCVCPSALNTRNCREEATIRTADQTLIIFAVFMITLAGGFLYYRRYVQGQSWFFPVSRERGLIRPRPQEAFHFFAGVFGSLLIVNYSIILVDGYPNMSWGLVGDVAPNAVGYGLFSMYPIGIIYSLTTISRSPMPENSSILNKRAIDAIAFCLLIGPILTLLPTAWLMGYYLDKDDGNISVHVVDRIFNVFWSFWTVTIFCTLIFFWLKMHFTLRKQIIQITQMKESEESNIKNKISRIRSVSRHLMTVVVISAVMSITTWILELLHSEFTKEDQLFDQNSHLAYVLYSAFEIPFFVTMGQIFITFNALVPEPFCCGIRSRSRRKNSHDKDDESEAGRSLNNQSGAVNDALIEFSVLRMSYPPGENQRKSLGILSTLAEREGKPDPTNENSLKVPEQALAKNPSTSIYDDTSYEAKREQAIDSVFSSGMGDHDFSSRTPTITASNSASASSTLTTYRFSSMESTLTANTTLNQGSSDLECGTVLEQEPEELPEENKN